MHDDVTSVVSVIQSYEQRSQALITASEKEKYRSDINPEMMSNASMFIAPHLFKVKSSIGLLKSLIPISKQ